MWGGGEIQTDRQRNREGATGLEYEVAENNAYEVVWNIGETIFSCVRRVLLDFVAELRPIWTSVAELHSSGSTRIQ